MLGDDEIARLRAETAGCAEVLHFNNAGAALMPDCVYRAVVDHLNRERLIGGYEAKAEAVESLNRLYDALADMLGCDAGEIAYVENATRAWDMAFYSIGWRAGDRVLTHASEYASNYLAFLQLKKRFGIEIDVAPSDASGQIDVEALPALIAPTTRLIALTHIPTQTGLVNPAAAVGRLARDYGLLFLLDACQSVGQMPLNVRDIGCHFLSGTGRKYLRGPRGTGFLYVASDIVDDLDPPFIDMHSAEWTARDSYAFCAGARRFENWESYVAGRVGLGVAVDYALALGLEAIKARITGLADRLREGLGALGGIEVADIGAERCGIVTFTSAYEPPEALHARLRARNINISTTPQTSARLDMEARALPAIARASVHYYNTEEEIARFCAAVDQRI